MVPTLMVSSETPVSFLQGLGALMGFRLSNCVPESAAPAVPVASRPTLAAARTEIPATARTHRCAFIDFPPMSLSPPAPGGEWAHYGTPATAIARGVGRPRKVVPVSGQVVSVPEVGPDVRRVPEKVHNGGSPSATLSWSSRKHETRSTSGTRTHPPSFYCRRPPPPLATANPLPSGRQRGSSTKSHRTGQ